MGVQLQLMDVAKRAREKTGMPMADAEASRLADGFGFSHSLPTVRAGISTASFQIRP